MALGERAAPVLRSLGSQDQFHGVSQVQRLHPPAPVPEAARHPFSGKFLARRASLGPLWGLLPLQTVATVEAVAERSQRSLEKELRKVLAFFTLTFWITKTQENRGWLFFFRAELEQPNWHPE